MAGTLVVSPVAEGVSPNDMSVPNGVFKVSSVFTDSNPASGISNVSIGNKLSGMLTNVRVVFGSPAPNTATISVKDSDGHAMVSGTLAASGSLFIDYPKLFVGGMTLTISGNTTASAVATVICYFM